MSAPLMRKYACSPGTRRIHPLKILFPHPKCYRRFQPSHISQRLAASRTLAYRSRSMGGTISGDVVFKSGRGAIDLFRKVDFSSMVKPLRRRREKRLELLRPCERRRRKILVHIQDWPSGSRYYTRPRSPWPQTILLQRTVREPKLVCI